MIGAFPGCRFVLEGVEFYPVVGVEVKDADGVESLFIGSTSSKEKKMIVDLVIAESAIRSFLWEVSCGFNLFPSCFDEVILPKIVHVSRVFVVLLVLAKPPKM